MTSCNPDDETAWTEDQWFELFRGIMDSDEEARNFALSLVTNYVYSPKMFYQLLRVWSSTSTDVMNQLVSSLQPCQHSTCSSTHVTPLSKWLSAEEAKKLLEPYTKLEVDGTVYAFTDIKALEDGVKSCVNKTMNADKHINDALLRVFLKLTSLARGYDMHQDSVVTVPELEMLPVRLLK